MSFSRIRDQFEKHVIANYARFPLCVARGEGSRVWDVEGREYLDLFPGWGVAGLGHCHPAVAEAIARQAGKLIHVANHYYCEEQGEFGEILSRRCGGRRVFFCNSGAEANEGAIKLARLVGQPRHKIIAMRNSFHGRTFGAISATGQAEYQRGFTPVVPGFSHAEVNDLASVEALLDSQTCAIMIEPVQGEAGVVAAAPAFLASLRKICDERGLLLIFDEVQTAPCRLGEWFGHQYFKVEPDLVATAKSIAGGMPTAAFLARPEVAEFLKPGTHASTFGGHSLGCAAGIAAFKAMEEERVMDNIRTLGSWLDDRLGTLVGDECGVKAIRRVGFMIGVELAHPGAALVDDCREHGLLVNCTHRNIIRLLPAFNIEKPLLERGLEILAACLKREGWRRG
ncbi:MAG: aspartate aminotransferase family protein [Planctomycetota bacterium]|jgi:predicted acetylornithine/succinylornithine family transaminase|nr:aspartate aminotransferase family protein [Planctomycetota bacterium]